jgi:hypothetical protein
LLHLKSAPNVIPPTTTKNGDRLSIPTLISTPKPQRCRILTTTTHEEQEQTPAPQTPSPPKKSVSPSSSLPPSLPPSFQPLKLTPRNHRRNPAQTSSPPPPPPVPLYIFLLLYERRQNHLHSPLDTLSLRRQALREIIAVGGGEVGAIRRCCCCILGSE